MPFKGKDSSGWKDAGAVYGKNASGWQYAKVVYAKDSSGWKRAWTDCRKHDEGGRDWTASSAVIEYQGSCTTRQSRSRTDYTKDGCTGYSRYTSWVAAPTCAGACTTAKTGNFSSGGIDFEYQGSPGNYYAFPNPYCSNGCNFSFAFYYVTTCGGIDTITVTNIDPCVNAFGDPC